MTPESAQAIAALLELPDPPELQHRGYQVTCEGHPDRFEKLLPRQPLVYTQYLLPEVFSDAVAERLRVGG